MVENHQVRHEFLPQINYKPMLGTPKLCLPLILAIGKIKNRLPIMLLRCEADDIARDIDQKDVDAALPKIVAWAETKTHRRA